MDKQQKIDCFYDALISEYKAYIDDVIKSIGFLILALGWVLTSKNAQALFGQPNMATIVIGGIVILMIANLFVYFSHYNRSARLSEKILDLDHDCADIVDNYRLTCKHIVLNLFTILSLFGLLITLVLQLKVMVCGEL